MNNNDTYLHLNHENLIHGVIILLVLECIIINHSPALWLKERYILKWKYWVRPYDSILSVGRQVLMHNDYKDNDYVDDDINNVDYGEVEDQAQQKMTISQCLF